LINTTFPSSNPLMGVLSIPVDGAAGAAGPVGSGKRCRI
jgi:hypothetical protein